jgi:hypothetical protein
MVNITKSPSIMTSNTARIAAFAIAATMLAMMAFMTLPAAEAALVKKLVIVKITNNTVKILNVNIKVKDVANNNKIVYVKNVQVLSGNTVTVNAPIVISGNAINVCAQVLNIGFAWQQCKAVTFGDTFVKTVTFTINNNRN